MTPYTRTFPQPDGSTLICEARKIDGVVVRLPNRIIKADGTEAKPAPVKEPRRIETKRIEPKRTNRPATQPAAPPINRTDCLHILEATGDSVEQLNCGCVGNKMTSVWECELFGRVAPFAKGDPLEGVRACQKCGAYAKQKNP